MRIITLFITINFIFGYTNAQNLKTYRGEKTINDVEGIENYTYYEKDNTRFKNGSYSFKATVDGTNEHFWNEIGTYAVKVNFTINGQFKNGLADGAWTCLYDVRNYNSRYTNNNIIKQSIVYKNGLPNGKFTSTKEFQNTFTGDGKVHIEKTECNFKEGRIIGKYKKEEIIKGFTDPVNSSETVFDLNGYYHQDKYINGFDTNELYFADYDTTINIKVTENAFYITEDYGYNPVSFSEDFIFKIAGYLDEMHVYRKFVEADRIQINDLIVKYTNSGLNQKAKKIEYEFSLFNAMQNIANRQYKTANDWYLRAMVGINDKLVLDKIELLQVEIKYDSLMTLAYERYKNGAFGEAKELCKSAIQIKPSETSSNELIKKIEKDEIEFSNLIEKANNEYRTKNYENAKTLLIQAQKIKPNDKSANEFLSKIENECNELILKADKCFLENDFESSIKYSKEILLYDKSNKKYIERISIIEQANNEIVKNNEQIETEKGKLEPLLNKLYKKVYNSVNTNLENQLSNENNIFNKIIIQQRLLALYSSISTLLTTRNKETEKQLKDVETFEQYIKILNI